MRTISRRCTRANRSCAHTASVKFEVMMLVRELDTNVRRLRLFRVNTRVQLRPVRYRPFSSPKERSKGNYKTVLVGQSLLQTVDINFGFCSTSGSCFFLLITLLAYCFTITGRVFMRSRVTRPEHVRGCIHTRWDYRREHSHDHGFICMLIWHDWQKRRHLGPSTSLNAPSILHPFRASHRFFNFFVNCTRLFLWERYLYFFHTSCVYCSPRLKCLHLYSDQLCCCRWSWNICAFLFYFYFYFFLLPNSVTTELLFLKYICGMPRGRK